MNLHDCRRILKVSEDAGLVEVKAAFRKLAFQLHPDLNPSPNAAARFRELNEAYVLLSHSLKDEPPRAGRTRAQGAQPPPNESGESGEKSRKAQAGKAYAKGAAQSAKDRAAGSTGFSASTFQYREEEVLRDLLADPFARQVFEDIYSELKHGKRRKGYAPEPTRAGAAAPEAGAGKPARRRRLEISWGDKKLGVDLGKGLMGGVKSWLKGQLDDEQTVSYPAHALGPGRSVRLTITARFGEPRTVEITLPQDFVVGRPVRLKGLGSKLGPFTGDLFLRILAK